MLGVGAAGLAAGLWLPRPWRVGQVIIRALDVARVVISEGRASHAFKVGMGLGGLLPFLLIQGIGLAFGALPVLLLP